MSNKITKEQTKAIAELSKLNLTEQELENYSEQLSNILDYVSQVSEADTSGVELKHNLENEFTSAKAQGLYEDEVKESKITREEMLKNATDGREKNGYVKTSGVRGEEE